jgi:HD-GYP domain-containing protein (c-di-GMP phosphodiesterase class II)
LNVGKPLPWNVFNEQSQLLLSKGYTLRDHEQLDALLQRGMFVDQGDFDQHQRTAQQDARRHDPSQLWQWVQGRLGSLLNAAEPTEGWSHDLHEVADEVNWAMTDQREPSLFETLAKDDPREYAVAHAMQTAFLSCLVGERMGWSEDERRRLTHAALTMNVGMNALQTQLTNQLGPLSSQQRDAVRDHGRTSRAWLERAGITDRDWLHAVEHHHVTPNGGALTEHAKQAGDLACMMHYNDVYLAKISARASRAALPSHVASRTLFMQADGQRNPFVSSLIKELGIYPPGSCVKLANGETGVVVQRGEAAHLPKVCSLLDPVGRAFPEPVRRDTALAPFKVVDALPRGALAKRLPTSRRLQEAVAG